MDAPTIQPRIEISDPARDPATDRPPVVEELPVVRMVSTGPDEGGRRLVRRLAQLIVVFAVGCTVGLGIGTASQPVSATPDALDPEIAPPASDGPAAMDGADDRPSPRPGCSVVAATGHLTPAGEAYLAMHGQVPPAMPWFIVPTTPLVQRCVSPFPPFPVHEMPVRQAPAPLLP